VLSEECHNDLFKLHLLKNNILLVWTALSMRKESTET
jgi:hypothetical protein